MSGFKNFALVGSGHLGDFIVEELLQAQAAGTVSKVLILTRTVSPTEGLQKFAAAGASIVGVDYTDQAAVTKALAGIDAVISTLPLTALAVEHGVAEASKAAGVKLFVQSEWGNSSLSKVVAPGRAGNREKMRAIGLPWAVFNTGPWSDFLFVPFLRLDVKSGKAEVGGDGNSPISFTSRPDAARYVVYALTQLPVSTLEYKIFEIEGERKSFNEVFKAYEAKTGKKVDVAYKSIRELQAAVAANPADFVSTLHIGWASEGLNGPQLDNELYPDWHPKPVIDYLT
ncbi:NAD-P-binding protein [Artomyces pyxidatus]|uniref:NAD-P-binding protein n=1 Tax=Artomyces pyxidatus TaxID=48021 RepID=A0ACB8SIT6_9AGAM|nr:NAD-P-binding protein [Artomyces pyxidatus]